MKTKLIILGMLFATVICSCTAPRYLPKSGDIDVNQYGSFIRIKSSSGPNIQGELIAIDSSHLVVLIDGDFGKTAVLIPIEGISSFKLRYAHPRYYGWTIPVFTLATIGHGWYAIFTAPINLIVTTSVAASGAKAFQYSDDDMTYEKLKMFARFPQGIPTNIDLGSIK